MKKTFPIVKNLRIFSIISAILIIVGLAGAILLPFGVNLFNMDIDFVGGTTMHFAVKKDLTATDLTEIATLFEKKTGSKVSPPQKAGDGTEVIVTSKDISTDIRSEIIKAMKDKYSLTDDDILSVSNVSPKIGEDLQRAAILSAIVAVFLMLIYITIRFEISSGISAVICLMHDLFVMLSIYIIFQIPLNLNFIAAALTILGYSINASIIVFDRVRENARLAKREEFKEIVEKSLWQSMGRTINTTITTLLPIVMIFILGVPSLKNFTLPLIVGIIAGAYSSIFLSGPIWVVIKNSTKKRA